MQIWESKAVPGGGALPRGFVFGDAGVDLFFVISGFIMVHIQPERIGSLAGYFRFLAHRITRIYPPYWLVSAALLPLWFLKPTLFNNFYHNQVDVVGSFLLLPQDYTPLLAVGWTLIHEVYFYLIVSIALVFGLRGRVIFGLLWFSLVLGVFVLFGQSDFGQVRWLQLVTSPFSMTFLLGYGLGLAYPLFRRMPRPVMGLVLVTGVAALVAGIFWIPGVGVYPNNNHLFRFVAYGIPCFLIVGASVGLEKERARWIRSLRRVGDASYAIYLLHLPVIAGFYAVIKKFSVTDPVTLLLTAGACFVTCIGVSVLFHRVIERRMLRATRHLMEKPPKEKSCDEPLPDVR